MKSWRFQMCLAAVAAIAIFAQPANAAVAPSYNWTGFYIGAHFGGGLGSGDMSTTPLFVDSGKVLHDQLQPSTVNPDPSGVEGGAQFGFNLQRGRFVYGIEADVSGSDMNGSRTGGPFSEYGHAGFRSYWLSHQGLDWYGTLRPRIGYTLAPALLVYGTGGLAFGHASYSANFGGPGYSYPASISSTKAGWTLGAGLEYALNARWSVRLEYLYVDLGSETAIGNRSQAYPFEAKYAWDTAFHVVDAGLNFKF